MSRPAARPAWYRLRVTLRSRLAGCLTLAVIPAASVTLAARAALILASVAAAVPGRPAWPAPALRSCEGSADG